MQAKDEGPNQEGNLGVLRLLSSAGLYGRPERSRCGLWPTLGDWMTVPTAAEPAEESRRSADRAATPGVQLGVATAGFALTFWAWALISPLGARYADKLDLSFFQQSLIVATPVLVGSLGRIPVGALTDALGARKMFPAIAGLTILPVLFIGLVADSLAMLLLGGFFLGLDST